MRVATVLGVEVSRRAETWFWATVLGATLPVVALAALVTAGFWLPTARRALQGCVAWTHTPQGLLLTGLLAAALAYPAARTLLSLARRLRDTRRWLRLVEAAAVAPQQGPHWDRVARLGLADRVRLLDLPLAAGWTVGLWRPAIVVTTGLLCRLGADEFDAVIHHELHHFQRRHPLRALLVAALQDGFGWLPAVVAAARTYEIARELAADAASERGSVPGALRTALEKCLADTCEVLPRGQHAPVPAFTDVARVRLARLNAEDPVRVPVPPVSAWLQTAAMALVAWGLGAAACSAALR